MITGATSENPVTGIRTTTRLSGSWGTHKHLAVMRRYVRTDPLLNEAGEQIGWHTKPADWFLAWGERQGLGTRYTYDGLENERGFKTKREATARKKEIYKLLGWLPGQRYA